MNTLSSTLAAILLSLSLAPAASAYGTEPESQSFARISPIAMSMPQTAHDGDTCVVEITPDLASIIGLSDDWRPKGPQTQQTALACTDE